MTHLTLHTHTLRTEHPGLFHFGEAGLVTMIGLAVVGALVLLGAYFLAENALQGLAAMLRSVS